MPRVEVTIGKNDGGQRLDKFLTKSYPNLPQSMLYKAVRKKDVKVNGKRCESSQRLQEGDVVSLSVKREYDDGRLEYEVKFWVDTTEYEYTVDGATGDIRKSEREPHPSASSADIGQDQAVSIALAHAGLSQSQVYRLEAEREWEDDHLEYQVEFKAGGMEYSYDIAASDGAILSFEREKD